MGPAGDIRILGFTENPNPRRTQVGENSFGKNRTERAIKVQTIPKELEKDQRIASQDPIEKQRSRLGFSIPIS